MQLATLSRLVRTAPISCVVLAVALWAFVAQLYALLPQTPLAERDGFADAVQSLTNEDATTFVVVSPPEQTLALDALPKTLVASDAIPPSEGARDRWSSIVTIGPRDTALPLSTETDRKTFADVDVVRYRNATGERVLFDLARDLMQTRVTLRGEPDIVCNGHGDGGYTCPGRPAWNRVGPARIRVGGQSWPSTWAHPVATHALEIDLGERILGDRIILEAGFDDPVATKGAAVSLTLTAGTVEKTYRRHPGVGPVTFTLPTTRGERAPVKLTIRTANDGARHLGVRLRLVEALQ